MATPHAGDPEAVPAPWNGTVSHENLNTFLMSQGIACVFQDRLRAVFIYHIICGPPNDVQEPPIMILSVHYDVPFRIRILTRRIVEALL